MTKITDKTEKKQRQLANLKPFKKGQSGNPNGRPKGTFSLITILKKKLQELKEGSDRTYAELLVERIVKDAIADGDDSQIKNILQYIEGMPKQTVRQEFDDMVTEIK